MEFPRLRARLLDLATSFEGKRLVAALYPETAREDAEHLLSLVAALKARAEEGRGLPSLEVDDLTGVFSRLKAPGSVLSADELLGLAPLLRAVRVAKRALEAAREPFPELAALGSPLRPLPHVERALDETFEATGEIKDSASPDLRRLRRERETRRERLRSRMEKQAGQVSDRDTASLVTLREGRFVLTVPQGQKGQVQGLVQDRSASGATFFIEPMEVVEDNNSLREIDAEERAEIRRILAALTDRLRGEGDSLRDDYRRVGELDALRARAVLAVRWGGERPVLTEERRLFLTGARHPLLLEARRGPGGLDEARAAVVPLALELDEDTRILLLTGPNMGGKTVALKCLGLLSVMAQSGCLIPADAGAVLPWFDRWVVSLGDEQSLEADLSTFGAHLGRWGEALEAAGPRTFALLDELGSGTDPLEGAALAQSVLERLAETHTMGLVTTHLGTLKGYAAEAEGVRNASMEFDPSTRRPAYRLAVGIPGKSHAIEMARSLGFPLERVERAEALLPQEERDVSRLLEELEAEQKRLIAAREEAERTLGEARRLETERKARLNRILEERTNLRAKAARQAREIIRRAEAQLRQAEAVGRSDEKEKTAVRRELAKNQARMARLETPASQRKMGPVPRTVEAGRRYWAELLGREVEVARGTDSGGRVQVVQGGVRVELPATSLRELSPAPGGAEESKAETAEPVTPAPRSAGATVPEVEEIPTEVDLRGMRVEEALERLDQALDRALLAGLHEIRVIHGKGTGALRAAVDEYCRKHTVVASAKMASQWEGGAGATMIVLED